MTKQTAWTIEDMALAKSIARRFAKLRVAHGIIEPAQEAREADEVALLIRAWHLHREPLRLDLLAQAEDHNLAHDVGGIVRDDRLMSCRFALAYHPRAV